MLSRLSCEQGHKKDHYADDATNYSCWWKQNYKQRWWGQVACQKQTEDANRDTHTHKLYVCVCASICIFCKDVSGQFGTSWAEVASIASAIQINDVASIASAIQMNEVARIASAIKMNEVASIASAIQMNDVASIA